MDLFDRTISKLEENKRIKEEGGYNCIPFGLPRFEEALPGIMQGTYYIVTANSGVGKSQFARKYFLINPLDFVINHPDSGIDLKIFYFSMEESADRLMSHLICNRLYEHYNICIDVNNLRSIGRDSILPDEILEKIKETREYFESLEDKVEIYDESINPYGIYNKMKNYAEANGSFTYKDMRFYNDDGTSEVKRVKDQYIPDKPHEYVMCIVDHISLLNTERDSPTKHQAIQKLSSEYFVPLRNRYGHTIVNVQQQAADSEKKQYTVKGDSILEKVEPSLDGLGDNKMTQRDANVVLGLFAPNRHNIDEHAGYNISKLQDNYRSLSILKNRDGMSDTRSGLYFDGRTNFFKELPRAKDGDSMEKVLKFREKEMNR